jgi:hypothetical protein|tara:strand:- start:3902 stop:4114 length:213 start_codon:yes stop_codon:yes gene_type:complete
MQQITEAEFAAILMKADEENAERESVGLSRIEVTTKTLGALSGSGSLIEYTFGNTMFGFIQNGIHYSNGL